MKKLFCAILMLLLCVSCFAGTLYIKAGEKIITYENVTLDVPSPTDTIAFRGRGGRRIIVGKASEWWYVE